MSTTLTTRPGEDEAEYARQAISDLRHEVMKLLQHFNVEVVAVLRTPADGDGDPAWSLETFEAFGATDLALGKLAEKLT